MAHIVSCRYCSTATTDDTNNKNDDHNVPGNPYVHFSSTRNAVEASIITVRSLSGSTQEAASMEASSGRPVVVNVFQNEEEEENWYFVRSGRLQPIPHDRLVSLVFARSSASGYLQRMTASASLMSFLRVASSLRNSKGAEMTSKSSRAFKRS